MDFLSHLSLGFSIAFTPFNLMMAVAGVMIGMLIGALPGVGPPSGVAMLLPLTFGMDPTSGIIMLAALYAGTMYGGTITSVLINTPGESASVVTCLDGYQMALQGRAGPALGIAAFGSFIAGTFSVVMLMLLSPPLAAAALRFGPPEIFTLLLLGFTMITYLGSGSRLKAVAMALVGMFLGTIGLDPVTGVGRYTFDTATLSDGVGLVPMIMGLFGVSEVLLNVEAGITQEVFQTRIGSLLPTRSDWKESAGPIARGSLLGFVLGILPGVGAIIPTFVSYALEKRLSRTPERFGRGAIEGVAGPESANNAATGGSMIPLLTLGIAPNVVMAVLLGAFLVHGVQPGPLMLREHPDLFWGVVASMYVGNIMLLILNLPLIGLWVQILRMPYGVLFPLILLVCVVGVYGVSVNVWDIVIMLGFGVAGYLLRKTGYEPAPLVLAFVLGRLAEESIRQSLLLSRGRLGILVERPIAAAFLVATAAVILLPLVLPRLRALLARAAAESPEA